LRHGQPQPKVRQRALAIIATGRGLSRWEGTASLARRRRALEQLRKRLSSR
jgi:hypothetical protein